MILNEHIKYGGPINTLDILVNIDGLPISKSGVSSLWLILCSSTVVKSVYIVGAFYGETKPENNIFLEKFVNEAIYLINNSLFRDGKKIEIKLHALVCDAPAKSFVLGVKNHNGYYSCTKCTIEGKYVNGRVCFPIKDTNPPLRTDEDFLNNKYEDFQIVETILSKIPKFGPITDVPLDYMHLVCLGVVKKLILLWLTGPLSVRLSNNMINNISEQLMQIRNSVPYDYTRRPRSLKHVRLWKATEFRQFLLYTGPVILMRILKRDVYINFLSLHVAMTIIASPILSKHELNVNYAQSLLEYFVASFTQIYGEQYVSHNIHNLLHICTDVRKYGPVDTFSAFKFENHMTNVKKLLRKPDKPLQQLARRYAEIETLPLSVQSCQIQSNINFRKPHNSGPLIDGYNFTAQFKILENDLYSIYCDNERNNCVLLNNGDVVLIFNLVQSNDNNKFIIGKKLRYLDNLYSSPCASSTFNIQIVKIEDQLQIWPCDKLQAKMWIMSLNKNHIVFPIIHT
ncbi:hypothetical protein ALC62_09202 [Cyphomyrmex costatus]|uniref:DUF4218 domain-containing protein n=1 Tax=Cyphomyrmex costatus TaxID=456900 RepID=A0A151IFY7_9HYME|nr:hypothetical protein ALC62_09202 [Cyphomyrmex costatus]